MSFYGDPISRLMEKIDFFSIGSIPLHCDPLTNKFSQCLIRNQIIPILQQGCGLESSWLLIEKTQSSAVFDIQNALYEGRIIYNDLTQYNQLG
jgi:hypothetical protein